MHIVVVVCHNHYHLYWIYGDGQVQSQFFDLGSLLYWLSIGLIVICDHCHYRRQFISQWHLGHISRHSFIVALFALASSVCAQNKTKWSHISLYNLMRVKAYCITSVPYFVPPTHINYVNSQAKKRKKKWKEKWQYKCTSLRHQFPHSTEFVRVLCTAQQNIFNFVSAATEAVAYSLYWYMSLCMLLCKWVLFLSLQTFDPCENLLICEKLNFCHCVCNTLYIFCSCRFCVYQLGSVSAAASSGWHTHYTLRTEWRTKWMLHHIRRTFSKFHLCKQARLSADRAAHIYFSNGEPVTRTCTSCDHIGFDLRNEHFISKFCDIFGIISCDMPSSWHYLCTRWYMMRPCKMCSWVVIWCRLMVTRYISKQRFDAFRKLPDQWYGVLQKSVTCVTRVTKNL